MKRGWKLDPQWVAYYEKRDADRIKRQIDRMLTAHKLDELNAQCDRAMRDLGRQPVSKWRIA